MRPKKLSESDAQEQLKKVDGWKLADDVISKTYAFKSFVESLEFVNKLGASAEEVQHHPDIDIRYSKVTIALTTHDAGGLTQFDFDLAKAADGFAEGIGK